MTVLQPGSVIGGRYRIERELAQGGFGAVYIALHTVTEELVALKVLWPQVLKSKDAVARFQFEATVAAKVGSDNIVRVLDAGFDEGTKMPYLVMELLKGKTLEAMIEQEGPMRPPEVLGVLSQTASALDKAHGYRDADGKPRPIVHRDLKPDNLFLARRESGDPWVKILDFGIAKVLSDTSKVSREAKGTPLFMSHEQLVGTAVGPFTDVWALGLIAFFLMTGKPYWQAASNPDADINALFAELLTSALDPPSVRASALGISPPWPHAFDAWFLRCLDRDPSRRFQAAGEAIRELGTALEEHDSTPDSPAMVKARTMLGFRYRLDQTNTPATRLSLTHGGASPEADRARAMAPSGSVPAISQSQSQTSAPATNPMPVLYAAIALALVSTGALVFALTRPSAPSEPRPSPAASVEPPAAPPASSTPAVASSAPLPPLKPGLRPGPLPPRSVPSPTAPTPPSTTSIPPHPPATNKDNPFPER